VNGRRYLGFIGFFVFSCSPRRISRKADFLPPARRSWPAGQHKCCFLLCRPAPARPGSLIRLVWLRPAGHAGRSAGSAAERSLACRRDTRPLPRRGFLGRRQGKEGRRCSKGRRAGLRTNSLPSPPPKNPATLTPDTWPPAAAPATPTRLFPTVTGPQAFPICPAAAAGASPTQRYGCPLTPAAGNPAPPPLAAYSLPAFTPLTSHFSLLTCAQRNTRRTKTHLIPRFTGLPDAPARSPESAKSADITDSHRPSASSQRFWARTTAPTVRRFTGPSHRRSAACRDEGSSQRASVGLLATELSTALISSGHRGYGVGRNLSRTPPLHGLRTADPSMGRTPPGQNPADAVGKITCYRGNERD